MFITILLGTFCMFAARFGWRARAQIAAQPPAAATAQEKEHQEVDLPSSQRLSLSLEGPPLAAASFPVSIAISPDGRYAVAMNDGYGSKESNFRQSLAVFDLATGKLTDFPDRRLGLDAHQSYFVGLAFSSDGKRLFASVGSLTDPRAELPGSTGNGIAVYKFDQGKVSPEKFIPLPLENTLPGKTAALLNRKLPPGTLIPYPAGIGVIPYGKRDRLLVAANLSDEALLVDEASETILRHFDLSTEKVIPGSYPYGVVVSRDARRAWVSLWNASQVVELNLISGQPPRWTSLRQPVIPFVAGSHPTALLLSPDEKKLYVALSNSDEIAVVQTSTGLVIGYISARLPGQKVGGAVPVGLAQSADGARLYVADAGLNAIAAVDTSKLPATVVEEGEETIASPLGFIPTEWYPLAVAVQGNDLLVTTGKGRGAGPNSEKSPFTRRNRQVEYPYIFSLTRGSVARIARDAAEQKLAALTEQVLAANRMKDAPAELPFAGGKSPLQHVIYIIKENRTYDQILGDLKEGLPGRRLGEPGRKVGNGDPSLTMFGEAITPNEHALAREFGVLDNFYDSGEVSGDGHNWSTAAIASDYVEKTVQINYRDNSERAYDYEGAVADRIPLEDNMPDVAEPGSGYIWANAARSGLSYRHYGEFVATHWCRRPAAANAPPRPGTPPAEAITCAKASIEKGEPLPPGLGQPPGSPSPWPWSVPILAQDVATKQDLRGHFDPQFPDFELNYPDQLRADEFLREFNDFVTARITGEGALLPNYILLRLPNDHTAGTRPGGPTPAASVADNDLAVGRVVEAVSQSPYWDDTAILIVEDDAQDGQDHVDAHRSIAFVISKYSPSSAAKPFVDTHFYTTVSMIHTLEALLGLPPMNHNDAYAPVMASLFSGLGKHAPFKADYRNRENSLIYKTNSPNAPGAAQSAAMDFTQADRANSTLLNQVLWRERMGSRPMPLYPEPKRRAPQHTVFSPALRSFSVGGPAPIAAPQPRKSLLPKK